MGKPDIDEAVGHRVEGDVAWVEAELQQYFLDPQIARYGADDAIENGARVQTMGAVHIGLTRIRGRRPEGGKLAFDFSIGQDSKDMKLCRPGNALQRIFRRLW